MTRRSPERLGDILAACDVISVYLERADFDGDLVFDAIRIRLVEIGEAVKDLDVTLTETEPEIPWSDIARMRDMLTHRYFDTAHSIVFSTARNDVPLLKAAVVRMLSKTEEG